MAKFLKRMWYTVLSILAIWLILTIWVNTKGKARVANYGNPASATQVIIVYDPDPFYNLDEQVCKAFAGELASDSTGVTVATVAAAEQRSDTIFSLYVFCANTYNWQPDRAISNYIKTRKHLDNKPVVAITLGAGSTAGSQKELELLIHQKKARLVDSGHFWLMRPNDETRTNEKNVSVAISNVRTWAKNIAKNLHQWL